MSYMLQKSSVERTAEFFFANPTKGHSLKEISQEIQLAHTSLKKNLKQLEKEGMITEHREKKGKRIFPAYQANVNSEVFRKYKTVHNISRILGSGIIDFIEEKLMPKCIVLFGSYSRGEDNETSDIDLFIECKPEELDLKTFERRLKRKIELHFKEDFDDYPKELKQNIINGIPLSGFLEVDV